MITLHFARVDGETREVASQTAHRLLEQQAAQRWPQLPSPLVQERTPGGKPVLSGYPNCHFNLSHSGEWAVCALSDTPVGVDIQQHRAVPARVVRRFTAEEQHWLEQHPKDFFDLWVKKEAFLKAIGTGLTRRLDSFSVLPPEENTVEGYRIALAVPPEAGYACAVCYQIQEIQEATD